MRPHGSPEVLEARRWIAAQLLAQGSTLTEVAAAVGASVSSVKRWQTRWEEYGEVGLQAQRHPGRQPKLSASQQRQLVRALELGTRHWGYRRDGWTSPLVRDLIRRRFGITYHPDHVRKLLRRLHWTPQKPRFV